MVLEQVKRHQTDDICYNEFTSRYSGYISEELDLLFCDLINNINGYLLNKGDAINKIKDILRKLANRVDSLDNKCETTYIEFSGVGEINLRLSVLLPKFVRLRQLAYRKAFYLASDIVEGIIPDYKLLEDFNLFKEILVKNSLENFYADLTAFLSDDSLDRFYSECLLLDLVSDILEGKTISMEAVVDLETNLDLSYRKIFDYIKKRFVPRTYN